MGSLARFLKTIPILKEISSKKFLLADYDTPIRMQFESILRRSVFTQFPLATIIRPFGDLKKAMHLISYDSLARDVIC